jgi:hypothetical protein
MKRFGVPSLFIFVVLLGCIVAAALATRAQSPSQPNLAAVKPLVLYDDFNGPRVDPAKWDNTSEPSRMREAVRELSPSYQGEGNNERLHIFTRSYSWTGNDDGVSWGWLGLQFPNPASIKEISFNVLVNAAALSGCQSNPSFVTVGAQFRGRFFNTGLQNGDAGDVEAVISMERDGTDAKAPLTVNAFYYTHDGTANDVRTLGFVSLGQTGKLRFKWDQPNHQFIAQLNNEPAVVMGYSIPDTFPPSIQYKAIQVTPGTPNCTTTPLGSAMIDAYFDNVYVNAY